MRDRRGRAVKVVKFASDITEQKLRAAASEGQIAAINRSQAVIHFTLDGTITDANANFLSTLGYTLDEIVGRHHSMFVTAEDRDSAAYRGFWKALAGGAFEAGEFKRVGIGGKDVWIHGSYNPIFDASGVPIAVVKFASDITQQVTERAGRTRAQQEIDADLGSIMQAMSDVSSQATTTADAAAQTSGNVQAVAAVQRSLPHRARN